MWNLFVKRIHSKDIDCASQKINGTDPFLIDLDVVRGSVFNYNKPGHGWTQVVLLGLKRVLFAPFHWNHWLRHSSMRCAVYIMVHFILQLFQVIFFLLTDPDRTVCSEDDVIVPWLLAILLGILHSHVTASCASESTLMSTSQTSIECSLGPTPIDSDSNVASSLNGPTACGYTNNTDYTNYRSKNESSWKESVTRSRLFQQSVDADCESEEADISSDCISSMHRHSQPKTSIQNCIDSVNGNNVIRYNNNRLRSDSQSETALVKLVDQSVVNQDQTPKTYMAAKSNVVTSSTASLLSLQHHKSHHHHKRVLVNGRQSVERIVRLRNNSGNPSSLRDRVETQASGGRGNRNFPKYPSTSLDEEEDDRLVVASDSENERISSDVANGSDSSSYPDQVSPTPLQQYHRLQTDPVDNEDGRVLIDSNDPSSHVDVINGTTAINTEYNCSMRPSTPPPPLASPTMGDNDGGVKVNACSTNKRHHDLPGRRNYSRTSNDRSDIIRCRVWEGDRMTKLDLTMFEVGWSVVRAIESQVLSSEYVLIGLTCVLGLTGVSAIFHLSHAQLLASNTTTTIYQDHAGVNTTSQLSTNDPVASFDLVNRQLESVSHTVLGHHLVVVIQLLVQFLLLMTRCVTASYQHLVWLWQASATGLFQFTHLAGSGGGPSDEGAATPTMSSILGHSVVILGLFLRFNVYGVVFLLLSITERAFQQRLLYAKYFFSLTSSRRARIYCVPHFRLNKLDHIRCWITLRSYLKKRGPQRSIENIIASSFYIVFVLGIVLCFKIVSNKDGSIFDCLSNWELIGLAVCIIIFLQRFIILGTKIAKKYRNLSVVITEQINIYLSMANKPHKKDELSRTFQVLRLVESLLKEVDGPFRICGWTLNPFIYNLFKLVLLSCFSSILSESLGFKLKLYKIKLNAANW